MKEDYFLKRISAADSKGVLFSYHYLSKKSKRFRSGINYGLIFENKIVGVCIFTGFSVPELAKGMLGLERQQQAGLFELSRLALDPEHQLMEHNLASWFVARCIKALKREAAVKVILTYADNDYHTGTVYKALGFKYYGLSSPKKDFWIRQEDGFFKKHNRGKVRGLDGEWRERSRKHRFAKVFDKGLSIKWSEQCFQERFSHV